MKGFNLSEWAINHRPFVWFLMLLFVVAGVLSYRQLGREEDPSFSIKTMLVLTYWPHFYHFPVEQFIASAILGVPLQKFFKGEGLR